MNPNAITRTLIHRRLALMVASADGIKIVCQTMQSLSKVKSFQELAARFFLVNTEIDKLESDLVKQKLNLILFSHIYKEYATCFPVIADKQKLAMK